MKVFIDPGHGGDDNGAVWGYAQEDDLNLAIGYLVFYELLVQDQKVKLSRKADDYVSLDERCQMANEWGADIFVSIHCDAFHKITASGMSVHIYEHTRVSEPLGQAVADALAKHFPDHRQRGVKRSNFQVLRETDCPAALVECEFLSNPDTRKWLLEPQNQIALARAITQGIEDYQYRLVADPLARPRRPGFKNPRYL